MASPPVAAPILILGRGRGCRRGRAASMGGATTLRAEPSRASRERDERETRADLSSSSFSSFIFARHRVRSRKISPRKRIFSNFSLFPPGFNIGRKQAALTLFLAIFHIAPDSISNSKSPRKKISTLPSFLISSYITLSRAFFL